MPRPDPLSALRGALRAAEKQAREADAALAKLEEARPGSALLSVELLRAPIGTYSERAIDVIRALQIARDRAWRAGVHLEVCRRALARAEGSGK